jgi:uncharacterized membrane protein
MITVKDYLQELKHTLAGADPATIQDALSDAEEYLTDALLTANAENHPEAFAQAVAQYGTPQEVAAAYVEAEARLSPQRMPIKEGRNRSFLGRFFGIYADSRAWSAILFLLISLVTGTVYFCWAITGLSLSISFLIFIFGLFFLLFFLNSLRGISLMEGRIVEALLGVRMPHRPLFKPSGLKWNEQLKLLLKDKNIWLTLVYILLQLPLSLIYVTLILAFLGISLGAMSIPVFQYIVHLPVITLTQPVFLPAWSMPLLVVGGILLLTIMLHTAKGIGILHGKWAKLMLVSN